MPHIDRFTVSLDTELLAAFDWHIADRGYQNRSEAVRDLIREKLVDERMQGGDAVVQAVLSLVCDHRTQDLATKLRGLLAEHRDRANVSLGVPLDDSRDLVVVTLRGSAEEVRAVSTRIVALRGVSDTHLRAVSVSDERITSTTLAK